DLAAQALAVTRGGDHDRVVARAETALADRAADQRAALPDDDLDETALGTGRVELEELVRRRIQTAHAQEVDERLDDADEEQPIVRAYRLRRRDGRNQHAFSIDLREKRAGQIAEARLLDALADHRARLLDEHLERVFARLPDVAQRRAALRQEPPLREEDIEHADDRRRQTDRADLEEADRVEAAAL